MAIEFECPACRTLVRVEDSAAGTAVRCGACEAVVTAHVRPRPRAAAAEVVPDVDPFELPRPRRRRPPPPPGRSTLFWILVIGGGLTAFVVLSCLGLFLLSRNANWQTFDSARGGYRVELPADPRDDMADDAEVRLAPEHAMEGTVLVGRAEHYVIVFGDHEPPGQRALSDEDFMKTAVRGLVGKEIRQVTKETPTTVSGFPAREMEVQFSDGGHGLGRVVVAETKFYIVLAGGPFAEPGNPRLRRFVDSFEVTDPAQLAARKEREEAGRRPKVNPWRKGAPR